MFKRSFRSKSSQQAGSTDSQHRVDKSARLTKKGTTTAGSVRDPTKLSRLQRSLTEQREGPSNPSSSSSRMKIDSDNNPTQKSLAPSSIVTLTVGPEGRLFAAHEDVLRQSPFFEQALQGHYFTQSPYTQQSRRITLLDEEPEIFSAILEYLYKGDYYPRLLHNNKRNSWELEDSVPARRGTPHTSPNIENTGGGRAASGSSPYTTSAVEATVFLASAGSHLLRDTVVYCAADRYGLEELKRLALRKQGLQSGIDVGTILRSAQYCYAHTPDSDSRLRAHYLALIIRCRKTFKRSGTMQAEMEKGGDGGKLFFDLFVALCNHLDDVIEAGNKGSPRTI